MGDTESKPIRAIRSLSDIAGDYRAIFCDVWGVVHNGVSKFAGAESALIAARKAGAKVVLLTNAPRPSQSVIAQLDAIGFDRKAYDMVVTSGDATRALIAKGEGPFYHIGPERDADLFADLGIAMAQQTAAATVIATGLFDDMVETPDHYRDTLRTLKDRDVPMVCANPDIVVHRGDTLIYCAGALAREYAAIGGKVVFAGKPHRPIYDLAAAELGIDEADRGRILAIGDGMMTDIKGANGFGVDALFVTGGIHVEELGGSDPSADRVGEVLSTNGLRAKAFIATLR